MGMEILWELERVSVYDTLAECNISDKIHYLNIKTMSELLPGPL